MRAHAQAHSILCHNWLGFSTSLNCLENVTTTEQAHPSWSATKQWIALFVQKVWLLLKSTHTQCSHLKHPAQLVSVGYFTTSLSPLPHFKAGLKREQETMLKTMPDLFFQILAHKKRWTKIRVLLLLYLSSSYPLLLIRISTLYTVFRTSILLMAMTDHLENGLRRWSIPSAHTKSHSVYFTRERALCV